MVPIVSDKHAELPFPGPSPLHCYVLDVAIDPDPGSYLPRTRNNVSLVVDRQKGFEANRPSLQ